MHEKRVTIQASQRTVHVAVYDSLDRLCSATLAGTAGDGKWLGGTLGYAMDDLGNLTGESVTSLTPPAGKSTGTQFPECDLLMPSSDGTGRLPRITSGVDRVSNTSIPSVGLTGARTRPS